MDSSSPNAGDDESRAATGRVRGAPRLTPPPPTVSQVPAMAARHEACSAIPSRRCRRAMKWDGLIAGQPPYPSNSTRQVRRAISHTTASCRRHVADRGHVVRQWWCSRTPREEPHHRARRGCGAASGAWCLITDGLPETMGSTAAGCVGTCARHARSEMAGEGWTAPPRMMPTSIGAEVAEQPVVDGGWRHALEEGVGWLVVVCVGGLMFGLQRTAAHHGGGRNRLCHDVVRNGCMRGARLFI